MMGPRSPFYKFTEILDSTHTAGQWVKDFFLLNLNLKSSAFN